MSVPMIFIGLMICISISIFYIFLMKPVKEGLGNEPPSNLMNELQVKIPPDNLSITIPNKIVGLGNNAVELNALNVNNKTIQGGDTFIKPVGASRTPGIHLAFGEKTGFNRDSPGVLSCWGNGEKIGSFGTNGITINNNRPFEFGKDLANKHIDAGKIKYTIDTTGPILDIIGAGNQGTNRRVRIQDNVDIGNTLNVRGTTDLNNTRINGHNRILGTNRLEFGANISKTNPNSGSIMYRTALDPNAMNIVGAEHEGRRKVHLVDEVEINGDLFIKGSLKVGPDNNGWSLYSENNGHCHFMYNNIEANNQDPNTGHIILSKDGDIWVAQSNYRGWVTSSEKDINDKINAIRAARLEAERIASEIARSDQKDDDWLASLMNFANIFSGIGDAFESLGDAFVGVFDGFGNSIATGMDTVGNNMTQGFDIVGENMTKGLDAVSENLTKGFDESIGFMSKGFDVAGENVTKGFDTSGDALKRGFEEEIPKTFKKVVNDMTSGFTDTGREITSSFTQAGEKCAEVGRTVGDRVTSGFNTVNSNVTGINRTVNDGFYNSMGRLENWFNELPGKIAKSGGQAASSGAQNVGQQIGNALNPRNWR